MKVSSLAVIMDGNRRWAKAQGLPSLEGHRRGYNKLKEMLDWCEEAGIDTVYAYAFSTENWKRTKDEVSYMMDLLKFGLLKEKHEFIKRKVKFRAIGQISDFSEDIQKGIKELEEETKHFTKTLALCLSYGGRSEITMLCNSLKGYQGEITEDVIKEHLWTKDIPDPDMVIRTGGEIRLSNFLPWQAAYSELFFTDTLWPDFSKEEFNQLIQSFTKRQRRHGA